MGDGIRVCCSRLFSLGVRGMVMWAALSAALSIAGCKTSPLRAEHLSETARGYSAKDYGVVLERWTRHGQTRKDLGVVLDVYATYCSWDFRAAYVARYAELYKLPAAEVSRLREAALAAARAEHEFRFSAVTGDVAWNDFASPRTVWRLSLVGSDGRELSPLSVEQDRTRPVLRSAFYPTQELFAHAYVARFPRRFADGSDLLAGGANGFTLRLAGPRGNVDLRWQLGDK